MASCQLTLSTGGVSPVNWLGLEPMTAWNSFWVTSYLPAQKSPDLTSCMSMLLVKRSPGTSGAAGVLVASAGAWLVTEPGVWSGATDGSRACKAAEPDTMMRQKGLGKFIAQN